MSFPSSGNNEKKAVTIKVKSDDRLPNEKKKALMHSDDMETEEVKQKKNEYNLLVERLQDPCEELAKEALTAISAELRTGTSSMISVPLPLKFLRPHLETLEILFRKLPDTSELKKPLADVISVLATTVTFTEPPIRRALWYSLNGTGENFVSWGPEYLRNITREIVAEYEERQEKFVSNFQVKKTTVLNVSDLIEKVMEIVPYYIQRHNEIDAIDLLVEVQHLQAIVPLTDKSNYKRVTTYLMSLANYTVTEEDYLSMMTIVFNILKNVNEPCECIRIALKLGKSDWILNIIKDLPCRSLERYQIGYLLGQHRWNLSSSNEEEDTVVLEEDILNGLSNEWLSQMYNYLAKELDVLEPKLPEDIYKTHLEDKRKSMMPLGSAKQNLASTFVNAFVNCGFTNDNLMTVDNGNWVYKNKDHGIISASASLGAIMLWNVEAGFSQIDKFHWSPNTQISAGASMAFGLVCSGIRDECDPAFALLIEQLENGTGQNDQTIGVLLGLAFSHIGVPKEVFLDYLIPEVIDGNIAVDVSACTALTLGLSYLGTANETVAGALLQTLLERQFFPGNLDTPLAYMFALSLALLFFKQRDACEATLSALDAVSDHPMGRFAKECIVGCAYAGTGDVTKIQYFLRICGAHEIKSVEDKADTSETNKDNDSARATAGTDDGDISLFSTGRSIPAIATQTSSVLPTDTNVFNGIEQSVALISVALIALGEEIGSAMILRMLDHLLQYGGVQVCRGVPLCLGLLYASAPKPVVVEVLCKLTHDSESQVALNAIFALGLVGAGTNNSRIAEFLRQLATYYSKSANALLLVRIAQGLLYMGKGLLSLSPLHSDGFLIRPATLASLIVVVYSALFMKNTLLGRYHYLLYFLLAGATPRMLITLDENLKMLPITVRVGQKLDIAGVAGNPRTITGFQTHTTPVLLLDGERAELATDEYTTVGLLPLEGVVILKKI